jgi:hypothetical protein
MQRLCAFKGEEWTLDMIVICEPTLLTSIVVDTGVPALYVPRSLCAVVGARANKNERKPYCCFSTTKQYSFQHKSKVAENIIQNETLSK